MEQQTPQGGGRHWVRITREEGYDDVDIELIHESCEAYTVEVPEAPEFSYEYYTCMVQALMDDDLFDTDEVPDGVYEIAPWVRKYAAVPGLHGDEWDAGIEIVGAGEVPDGH